MMPRKVTRPNALKVLFALHQDMLFFAALLAIALAVGGAVSGV